MTGWDSARDYYRLLGVPRDASTLEIRRAYRRLARQHHPDRNPHPDSQARFGLLADAYAALNDPARRARYDQTIARTRPPQAPRRSPQAPRRPPQAPSWRGTLKRGTLELSPREAQLAAAAPLTFTGPHGFAIMLPAGIRDGDHIIVQIGADTVALAVRVNQNT